MIVVSVNSGVLVSPHSLSPPCGFIKERGSLIVTAIDILHFTTATDIFVLGYSDCRDLIFE
jgi:hypothetical protein